MELLSKSLVLMCCAQSFGKASAQSPLGRWPPLTTAHKAKALVWTGELHPGEIRSIVGVDLQDIHKQFQALNATAEFFSRRSGADSEMIRPRSDHWSEVRSPRGIVDLFWLTSSQICVQCGLARPRCEGKDVQDGINYLQEVNGNCSAVGTGWGRVSCNGGAAVYWGNIVGLRDTCHYLATAADNLLQIDEPFDMPCWWIAVSLASRTKTDVSLTRLVGICRNGPGSVFYTAATAGRGGRPGRIPSRVGRVD
jgi:hypothetical protein